MPGLHDPVPDASFDFYGLGVRVESPGSHLVEEVRRDFSYFESASAVPGWSVTMHLGPAPYDELPASSASFLSPRNVVFRIGGRKVLDYFGRGLAFVDPRERSCVVHCDDSDLAHEIVYLFLLSTVGQYLDSRGLHRIHALGVSHEGRGLLLLLPSGGGKSTMALELMKQPGFRLLSEDTPLVDRRGDVHPFPLRLGVRPGQAAEIPEKYLRTMRRMEFDPKTLIDLEYIGDRLGSAVPASAIFLGERNSGDVSEIVPLGPGKTLHGLVSNLIVGLGVYQGVEFLLERGFRDLGGSVGIAWSRARAGLRLQRRAAAYRFVLGRNRERNTRCFLDFVERGIRDGVASRV